MSTSLVNVEELRKIEMNDGCRGCDTTADGGDDCDDPISFDKIVFPAYKNVDSMQCYNTDTVKGWIKSRHEQGLAPIDPMNNAAWSLPDELLPARPPGDKIFNATDVVNLHHAGKHEEALTLFEKTVDNCKWFDINGILALHRVGLQLLAVYLFDETLKYRRAICRPLEITELWRCGMKKQATSLFKRSIGSANLYSTADIIRLHDAGMKTHASQLFDNTHMLSESGVSYDDMGKLSKAGMKREARILRAMLITNI
jgi:hypothetical protein